MKFKDLPDGANFRLRSNPGKVIKKVTEAVDYRDNVLVAVNELGSFIDSIEIGGDTEVDPTDEKI